MVLSQNKPRPHVQSSLKPRWHASRYGSSWKEGLELSCNQTFLDRPNSIPGLWTKHKENTKAICLTLSQRGPVDSKWPGPDKTSEIMRFAAWHQFHKYHTTVGKWAMNSWKSLTASAVKFFNKEQSLKILVPYISSMVPGFDSRWCNWIFSLI